MGLTIKIEKEISKSKVIAFLTHCVISNKNKNITEDYIINEIKHNILTFGIEALNEYVCKYPNYLYGNDYEQATKLARKFFPEMFNEENSVSFILS